ncbi:Putative gonadotropin-releasing hormone receptor [Caligus rogercresseyi]|uniref:Gonadotropin-releasing hormone receptor n=1 Tax=Caligus rogercresseyi TaxID=217165 RepID=A0A7T8GNJ0_CALRO|nr:Putative gonadotropin-releasing hormone receptor [Caligus rogercresseyi]
MSLWHILDPETVKGVSSEIQDVLFLTAVLNSCINPLVYGSFYLRIFNRKNNRGHDSMFRSR